MKVKIVFIVLFILSLIVLSNNCTTLSYDARQDKVLMHIQDSLSRKVDSLVAAMPTDYTDMYSIGSTFDSTAYKATISKKQKELQAMTDSLAVIMANIIDNHLLTDSTNQANIAKYHAKIDALKTELSNIANATHDDMNIGKELSGTPAKIDSAIHAGGKGSWIGYVVVGVLFILALIGLYFKNKSDISKKVSLKQ